MYYLTNSGLGAWYDPLTSLFKAEVKPKVEEFVEERIEEASEYVASNVVPTALDKLIPAALNYVDKNRVRIWRQVRPVMENFGKDETVQKEVRPVVKRIAKRELARYGRKTYYPKYGRYAGPAIALGAGLLTGGLATGFLAGRKAAESPSAAGGIAALTYFLAISGFTVTLTGVGLAVGNKLFPHK